MSLHLVNEDTPPNLLKQANIILSIMFDSETSVIIGQHISNYLLLEDNQVIACCFISPAKFYMDTRDQYSNDFMIPDPEQVFEQTCIKSAVYNLARRPGDRFKGAGIKLLDLILDLKEEIHVSAVQTRLQRYYLEHGFVATSLFDQSENIGYRVLRKTLKSKN